MGSPRLDLTADEVRALLSYDPLTGVFTWRVNRSGTALAGTVAGTIGAKGYVKIWLKGRAWPAHRLAWLVMTGEWPARLLDHRNTLKSDNRWVNLRQADEHGNAGNAPRRSDNKSGVKGVHWCGASRRWVAMIGDHGRRRTLGRYRTIEAAAAAYARAATTVFGEFARAA